VHCARVVFSISDQIDVEFKKLELNCSFRIYYVLSNHYPARPIVGEGKVREMEINTIDLSIDSAILTINFGFLLIFLYALL